jgi:hypothetical protein
MIRRDEAADTPKLPFDKCWLRLASGWTVSVSEDDTPPALCCLAAWPTRQDNLATNMLAHYDELQFFDFGGGGNRARTDCRCWTFTDVREALIRVANALAPPS